MGPEYPDLAKGVYPSRRVSVAPLPNAWIHHSVGLRMALQEMTVLLPPLRTLLGPVQSGGKRSLPS
jgi:hypothetical protein